MIRSAVVVFALGACATKPDPFDVDTARRLAVLEQEVVDQHRRIVELEKTKPSTEEQPDLSAVIDVIEDLTSRVVRLESKGPAVAARHAREPDKTQTYSVPVTGSPAVGSPRAKVTIVM